MTFTLRPLSSALGMEVVGIDLREPQPQSVIDALRHAWHEHVLLLFRGQQLTHAQHVAFSKNFGALDDHAAIPKFRHPDHPEVLLVTNYESGGKRLAVGRQWHSDLSTTLRPAKGSLLYCSELPPVGGDTMFANMYRAYDTLSPGLRNMLDGLWALHDMSIARETRANRTTDELADIRRRNPPVFQPVIRKHDESGRKALYVSEMTTARLEHMTDDESAGLLKFLYEHSVMPENIYRHQWKVGDLMMWDNRSAMHIALADYDQTLRRVMYRTTLLGSPSGRVAQADAVVATTMAA